MNVYTCVLRLTAACALFVAGCTAGPEAQTDLTIEFKLGDPARFATAASSYTVTGASLVCSGTTIPLVSNGSGGFNVVSGKTNCIAAINSFTDNNGIAYLPVVNGSGVQTCTLGAVGSACPFTSSGATVFVAMTSQLPTGTLIAQNYSVGAAVSVAGEALGTIFANLANSTITVSLVPGAPLMPGIVPTGLDIDPGAGTATVHYFGGTDLPDEIVVSVYDNMTGALVAQATIPGSSLASGANDLGLSGPFTDADTTLTIDEYEGGQGVAHTIDLVLAQGAGAPTTCQVPATGICGTVSGGEYPIPNCCRTRGACTRIVGPMANLLACSS